MSLGGGGFQVTQQALKGQLVGVVIFPAGEVADMAFHTNARCPGAPVNHTSGAWYAAVSSEILEGEHLKMSKESPNFDLDQLTEDVAEQIMFVVGESRSDPKQPVIRLLRQYLEQAQERTYDDALRGEQREERDQQN
jgi:hypothetical protein